MKENYLSTSRVFTNPAPKTERPGAGSNRPGKEIKMIPSKKQRNEWRSQATNTLMVSAVGEYTPEEFTVLLDAVDYLEGLLEKTGAFIETKKHDLLDHIPESCYEIDMLEEILEVLRGGEK